MRLLISIFNNSVFSKYLKIDQKSVKFIGREYFKVFICLQTKFYFVMFYGVFYTPKTKKKENKLKLTKSINVE